MLLSVFEKGSHSLNALSANLGVRGILTTTHHPPRERFNALGRRILQRIIDLNLFVQLADVDSTASHFLLPRPFAWWLLGRCSA